MRTVGDIVNDARSFLSGPQNPEFGVLAQAYTPGDSTVTFTDRRRVTDGSTMCVGLTTLRVIGQENIAPAVVAGSDGSPNEPSPSGTLVLIMPRFTTWQVFTEVAATIAEISAPMYGLHAVRSEMFTADTTDNTYALSGDVLRVIRVRYRDPGSADQWYDVSFLYQPSAHPGHVVRVTSATPGGSHVQVTYATPFPEPTSLSDTLGDLSMPESYARLLAVGAARNLALSSESRRSQPFSQGDPRRAEEVSMGHSAMVYDRLRAMFRDLASTERSRLIQQYPYRQQMEAFYRTRALI